MSDMAPQLRQAVPRDPHAMEAEMPRWLAWIQFAGWVMLLAGTFHFLQGLVALFRQHVYVDQSRLAVNVDYTVWGWAHIALGVLVAATGVAMMVGKPWSRPVGLVLVYVSAVVNVSFLNAEPAWSVVMIALDVLVIYALTVHGRMIGKAG